MKLPTQRQASSISKRQAVPIPAFLFYTDLSAAKAHFPSFNSVSINNIQARNQVGFPVTYIPDAHGNLPQSIKQVNDIFNIYTVPEQFK